MLCIEDVTIDAGVRLLDHRHGQAHWMVVLDGCIREDGAIYRAGTVRASTADDRHFLVFDARSRCLILSGDLAAPSSIRRVIRVPSLVALAARGADASTLAGAAMAAEVVDPLLADVPSWLHELEQRRRDRRWGARRIGAAARVSGVSREHLVRTYRRYLGTSATEAIKAARLHAAWDEVASTGRPLADIAASCGFADQSHMSRHFAAWIGVAPSAVRRRQAEVTRLHDGSLQLRA